MALALKEGREMPGLVAVSGRLDLENFRAEIAEALGRERGGQHPRQIDDADALKRPGPLFLICFTHYAPRSSFPRKRESRARDMAVAPGPPPSRGGRKNDGEVAR